MRQSGMPLRPGDRSFEENGMNKSELIVGLDIGTTKICAVVGELSESGLVDVVGIGTSVSTGFFIHSELVVKLTTWAVKTTFSTWTI